MNRARQKVTYDSKSKISRIGTFIDIDSRLPRSGARGKEGGENVAGRGNARSWVQGFLWGVENVLELDRGGCWHNTLDVLNATGLYTLKWLILCYVN